MNEMVLNRSDSIFVAGNNGMVGNAIIKSLKKEKVIVIIKMDQNYIP